MRLCILGGGGLGSVVGGYLAEAGVDVTLIARPSHAEAIRKNGLRIHGQRRGEHLIKENLTVVTHPDQALGEFDYFMLAVKSKDTAQALNDAIRLKDRCATVVSLQNNIVKESLLAEWAGEAKVLGVSIIEGGTLEAPGIVVNHITATTTFYAGELDGTVSPRAEKLVAVMNSAGLPSKAVACIRQVLWEKLCQICNASAWSASTLPGNPELTFNEGAVLRAGAEHYVTLGYEILSVYTRMGYTPQNFYAPLSRLKEIHEAKSFDDACDSLMTMAQQLQAKGIRSRTSMHDDVLHHRKSEAPWILKPIIEKANEFGVQVPTLVAVDRILSVLDTYAK